MKRDIIVALATPNNPNGALAIIRLSGEGCIELVNNNIEGDITCKSTHTVTLCNFIEDKTKTILDTVLITVFKEGKSYTKEESVEISCHNSQYIIAEMIKQLINHGARIASNGEFTRRAYLNGRFDIIQAEAVADLIACQNKTAHDIALNQMQGKVSKGLLTIREKCLNLASLLDINIDFSEEDIDENKTHTILTEEVDSLLNSIDTIINNFERGEAIKNGLPIAIIGRPNVGKSSLLNCFLKEERCIVSDIAGTTRDTIDAEVFIGDVKCRFIDTAGLREGNDVGVIEQEGIRRTKQMISKASMIFYVIDIEEQLDSCEKYLNDLLSKNKNVVLIVNKIDLQKGFKLPEYFLKKVKVFYVSVKKNIGIPEIEEFIKKKYTVAESEIIVNARHYEVLTHIKNILSGVKDKLSQNNYYDMLLADVNECIAEMNNLFLQEISNEDVLDNIFKNFCIGK